MQYYTANDISKIIGCSQNKSYEIIRELNQKYKRKFPDSVEIQGKIPIWFFEETMGTGMKGKVENEKVCSNDL